MAARDEVQDADEGVHGPLPARPSGSTAFIVAKLILVRVSISLVLVGLAYIFFWYWVWAIKDEFPRPIAYLFWLLSGTTFFAGIFNLFGKRAAIIGAVLGLVIQLCLTVCKFVILWLLPDDFLRF